MVARRLLSGHLTALVDDRIPVIHERRRAAVDVEPGERLAENAAMGERALRARVGREVPHPSLQHDDLTEPFYVAPGQGQLAEPRT